MRAHPHFNPFSVREPAELPDWRTVFPNNNQIDLEIGFSNGTWLIAYAKKFPERNIIGVEIRKKFIESAKEKIKNEKLTNAYVLQANINTALPKLFKEVKLNNVFVLFPDPWRKKGHLKRRVITPEFLDSLASQMVSGGRLHIASDKQLFALEMLEVVAAHPLFKNTMPGENLAPENISGVYTDIEIYHLRLGNPVSRLVFQRI